MLADVKNLDENALAFDAALSRPAPHISQNIDTVAALMEQAERNINVHQKVMERVTAAISRPRFVVLVTAALAIWIAANLIANVYRIRAFDPPPFNWLQALIGVGALYTSLVVLVTQQRQGRVLEQRNNLQLQAILLTEQKVTKIIALLEELRRDLPNVANRADREAEALQEAMDAQAVAIALREITEVAAEDEA